MRFRYHYRSKYVIDFAKTPIRSQFIPITYNLLSIKNQKGKPCETDLPLLKIISQNFRFANYYLKPVIIILSSMVVPIPLKRSNYCAELLKINSIRLIDKYIQKLLIQIIQEQYTK